MGKIISLIRLGVPVLLCLFSFLASAKMEFPPTLQSDQDFQAFAARIRKLVPEIQTSPRKAIDNGSPNSSLFQYLKWEQELIQFLKANPEYMVRAEVRPPLQVLTIREVNISEARGKGVSPEWSKFLSHNGFETVGPNVLEELASLFESWPQSYLRGFFSGWAGFLGQDAREVLKLQDPAERWTQIKERLKNHDLSVIRQKFKADKFGVLNSDWNWSDLDAAVDRMIRLEARITVLIQQLNLASAARGEVWFHKDHLDEWAELPPIDNRVKPLLESLKSQLASIYTSPDARIVKEVPVKELILRELPPYLAIYRGCVGSDCSTSNSWAYPYAPTERNWWVESPDGQRMGYISGAITTVRGEPCLYIRDVTGPGLRPGDIPLILNALFLGRSFYGAKHMTIMNLGFVSENHFSEQRQELSAYAGATEEMNQDFSDWDIRERILGRQQASGATYDSPSQHSRVRYVSPSKASLEYVRVSRNSGSIEIEDPNKSPEALWHFLYDAVLSNQTWGLDQSYARKVDWKEVVYILRNEGAFPAQRYYQAVEEVFANNKLPFSRNMMKKNEGLFLTGHLKAPDAWKGENVRQSVRYLIDLIWRRKDSEAEAKDLIRENLKVVEQNELMIRNVKGLFARRQQDDLARISLLFSAGYRFTKVDLTQEELTWLSQAGTPELIQFSLKKILGGKKKLTTEDMTANIAEALGRMLNNEDESVDESISIEAARAFFDLPNLMLQSALALNEVQASIRDDDNPEIQVPLAMAHLRDMGHNHPGSEVALVAFYTASDNGQIPSKYLKEARAFAQRFPRPSNMPAPDQNCERALQGRG